jgi:hypothetical protein
MTRSQNNPPFFGLAPTVKFTSLGFYRHINCTHLCILFDLDPRRGVSQTKPIANCVAKHRVVCLPVDVSCQRKWRELQARQREQNLSERDS